MLVFLAASKEARSSQKWQDVLMANYSLEKVAGIDKASALELVRRLVEIESPTTDIDGCRSVINEANEILRELLGVPGTITEVKGYPTLSWKSGKPKVLLLCHLDTVWPKGSFTPLWSVEGDVARGPGIYDMKAGFIQAVMAIAALENRDGIFLLATTDEEAGSAASRELIEASAKECEFALIFESAIDGKVKTARKGTSMYRVEVEGRAAHAGLEPEKGINAMMELASLLTKITPIAKNEIGTSVTPTVFKAGTTLNTVPAHAQLDIDVRAFSREEQLRVDNEIFALAGSLSSGAKVVVTGGINRPALDPKMSKDLYEIAKAAATALGMAELKDAAVGGASDGNFTAALGIPTLDGLGSVGDGAHADHEWSSVSALTERSALVAEMLTRILK
jgi:glutamate carboxypeptidase